MSSLAVVLVSATEEISSNQYSNKLLPTLKALSMLAIEGSVPSKSILCRHLIIVDPEIRTMV